MVGWVKNAHENLLSSWKIRGKCYRASRLTGTSTVSWPGSKEISRSKRQISRWVTASPGSSLVKGPNVSISMNGGNTIFYAEKHPMMRIMPVEILG
jgi:hypothetical protein